MNQHCLLILSWISSFKYFKGISWILNIKEKHKGEVTQVGKIGKVFQEGTTVFHCGKRIVFEIGICEFWQLSSQTCNMRLHLAALYKQFSEVL